jgi:hypothetical protein
MASTAEELSGQSLQLQEMIAFFKVKQSAIQTSTNARHRKGVMLQQGLRSYDTPLIDADFPPGVTSPFNTECQETDRTLFFR